MGACLGHGRVSGFFGCLLLLENCKCQCKRKMQALDNLFGGAGGLPIGQVTEFCGAPGIGKTQLGMQLAVNVRIPTALGGLGGAAVYIDTEGSFFPERAARIAQGMINHFRFSMFQRQQQQQANSASSSSSSSSSSSATAAAAASAVAANNALQSVRCSSNETNALSTHAVLCFASLLFVPDLNYHLCICASVILHAHAQIPHLPRARASNNTAPTCRSDS
jgi:hypothetical protein